LYIFYMLVGSRLVALLVLASPAFSAPIHPLSRPVQEIARQAEEAQASDHLPNAVILYQKGLRFDPKWDQGWWSLASILYDEDRFPEAKDAFLQFVTLSSDPGPGYAFLALCEYETREYDQSLQHFRKWANKGWTGSSQLLDVAIFHFALLLTHEGSFGLALYFLSSEVQKNYSGPGLVEAIGLASLRMRNVPEDYPPERREAVWLAGEAAFYAASHVPDIGRANEYAQRLALHYDQQANVHYFLGTLRKSQSDYAGAATEYQRELQLSPNDAGAMVELAHLAEDEDRLEEAARLAKRASELDPKSPDAHTVYGAILLKSGSVEQGVRELEAAKKLVPDSASVRFQLAAGYRKLHRTEDAERETRAFNLLKDKREVIASPQEKLKDHLELLR
jgi:tetratricopeptide (TPR) repeat protein